jgi:hypothetical protein
MQRSGDGTQALSVKRIEGAPPDHARVPSGAYLLALGMGTLAFFAVVSMICLTFMALPPLPLWVDPFFLLFFALCYLLLALLFGFLWPRVSWKWGLWLSLPCTLTVIFLHLAYTSSAAELLSPIIGSLLIVSVPACAFAFIGQRYAPCEQALSNVGEAFAETFFGEQVITTQAHHAGNERFDELDQSKAHDRCKRDDAYIPTPMELFELFQQFQPAKTDH